MPENNFIYQDHYILAEQQEVSHDNSLSGNGTVNSPLGVVPGYNETVLWSGTPVGSTSGNFITLSENPSAFETIKVIAGNDAGSWSTISEYPSYAARWEFERIARDSSSYVIFDVAGLYQDSTNKLKWISHGGTRCQINSNSTINHTSISSMYVHGVIGINRKQ